jgi:hypothetical protein
MKGTSVSFRVNSVEVLLMASSECKLLWEKNRTQQRSRAQRLKVDAGELEASMTGMLRYISLAFEMFH